MGLRLSHLPNSIRFVSFSIFWKVNVCAHRRQFRGPSWNDVIGALYLETSSSPQLSSHILATPSRPVNSLPPSFVLIIYVTYTPSLSHERDDISGLVLCSDSHALLSLKVYHVIVRRPQLCPWFGLSKRRHITHTTHRKATLKNHFVAFKFSPRRRNNSRTSFNVPCFITCSFFTERNNDRCRIFYLTF